MPSKHVLSKNKFLKLPLPKVRQVAKRVLLNRNNRELLLHSATHIRHFLTFYRGHIEKFSSTFGFPLVGLWSFIGILFTFFRGKNKSLKLARCGRVRRVGKPSKSTYRLLDNQYPYLIVKREKRAAKTPFGTVNLSFGQFRTFYNSAEASLNLRKCRDVILDVFIFVEFTLLLANAF